MDDDTIPSTETYRDVPIHSGQSAKRRAIVRKAIAAVCETTDPADLFVIAMDASVPPEARILAARKAMAPLDQSLAARSTRPRSLDFRGLEGIIASLESRRWRDPLAFGSLLEGNTGKVPRERRLA